MPERSELNGKGHSPPQWFVIIPASDEGTVLDRFQSPGWAPAIIEYAQRIRQARYAEPVSLREARPGECSGPL